MTFANYTRFGQPLTLNPDTTPSFSNHAIDASNEGVAWAFQAKSTEAITHIGFRYGARAATPPTYIAGIEGLSTATGFPDGTYKGGGSPASGTFTPPASTAWDGTWQWVALANSYTPSSIGEWLCSTIRYSSGTIDGTNNSSFSSQLTNAPKTYFPYALRNTAGTWAISANAFPVFGIRTANLRYGYIVPNLYSTRTASTVGHRVAMKVNVSSGFGDTYKVIGIRFAGSIASAVGKNPLCKIWSASSALASATLDSDVIAISTAYRSTEIIFDTSVALSFGTDYYFGFEVADATSGGVILYGTQFASADDKATDDGGNYFSLATYNGSTWTDDATVRPWMELILEDWTEPASSGSIIAPMRVIQNSRSRR
jgi:hypothetical protein